jgi:photosynthetic reaction center H subunit
METGAITGYIDVAQVALYAFWIFFAGLIYYLRQEDKREGYPLLSDRSDRVLVQGFPPMPAPKTFRLTGGHTYQAPPGQVDLREVSAAPREKWLGAPLSPIGDPMLAGVGPGSWAERMDVPEKTSEGLNRFVPMRNMPDITVDENDADPRGMKVVGADGVAGGIVRDIWVDLSESRIHFLEVEVPVDGGARNVLIPMTFVRIDGKMRHAKVSAIMGRHFANIPGIPDPNVVTLRDEEMIVGYLGAGYLYASPERTEPLI